MMKHITCFDLVINHVIFIIEWRLKRQILSDNYIAIFALDLHTISLVGGIVHANPTAV